MWRVSFGGANEPPQHFIGARATLKRAKAVAEAFDGDLNAPAVKEAQRRDERRESYAEKKEGKAERMRARAERKREEASSLRGENQRLGDVMMGTPILVGHHSERRHRRDLERMHKRDEKAWQLQQEAASLERRATKTETSRAIDSDDPDAIEKLRAKAESITEAADQMVNVNKIIGRNKRNLTEAENAAARERLAAAGVSAHLIDKIMVPDPMGRIGFPTYAISNSRAEARRVLQRIEQLEQRAQSEGKQKTIGEVRIVEEENRVRVYFPGKPSAEVRRELKGSGFRWSPAAGAWQRKPSPGAWYAAEKAAEWYASRPSELEPSRLTPEQQSKRAGHNPHRYHVISRHGLDRYKTKAAAIKAAAAQSREDQGPGASVVVIDAATEKRLGDWVSGRRGYFTAQGDFRAYTERGKAKPAPRQATKIPKTLRGMGRQIAKLRKMMITEAKRHGTGGKRYDGYLQRRSALERAYDEMVRRKLAERPPMPPPKTRRAVAAALKRESAKLDALSRKGESVYSGSMQYHRLFERLSQLEEADLGFKTRAAARKGLL